MESVSGRQPNPLTTYVKREGKVSIRLGPVIYKTYLVHPPKTKTSMFWPVLHKHPFPFDRDRSKFARSFQNQSLLLVREGITTSTYPLPYLSSS